MKKKLLKCRLLEKYDFYYLKGDKYIGERVALGKYEPYESQLILREVKEGDVVIDIGANIGYYSILLADKVGVNGKVYAFEPNKICFEILKKNVEKSGLNNVVLVNKAVSDKKGINKLFISEENYGDHKLFKDKKNRINKVIKTVKLDDFFKNREEKINFIKIDSQGWEPAIIEGSKKIIKRDRPTIFFEYSPMSYKMAKLNGERMMAFMKRIYKKIFLIDEWFYIYRNLSKDKIDKICRSNKSGYGDLWVKKKVSFKDYLNQYKNLQIKKLIKRLLFRL